MNDEDADDEDDDIIPILKSLHWLLVPFRIEDRVSLLTHQCIHGPPGPSRDFLPARPPHASSFPLPQTCLRVFSSAALRLWNAIPDHLRASPTKHVFK